MWIFKDFPLNFKLSTWRLSQWVATTSFIAMFIVFRKQYFGALSDYNIVFTTPLGLIALVAIAVGQLYVYGGFITNTIKDILVPACVILCVFIVELLFSFVMKNLNYFPQWHTYIIRYTMLLAQSLIQLWVYNDVEFKEIPKDELEGS